MDREVKRALILTSLFGPVGAMGLIGGKKGQPEEPKPKEPKPVVLSPEDKAIAAAKTRRYMDAFHAEGFDFATACSYVPRTLMTTRWTELDHRQVHPLNTPTVGNASHISVGETDGRIYATWLFSAPMVVGLEIREKHTQVAGIYLGGSVPTVYAGPTGVVSASEDAAHLFDATVMAAVASVPAGGSVWIEHGWLLTDFVTLGADITMASAAWTYLDSVISAFPPAALRYFGCDYGQSVEPLRALSAIFPTIASSIVL